MQLRINGIQNPEWRTLASVNPTRRVIFNLVLPCIVGVTIGLLFLVSPWLALACTLGITILVVSLIKPVFLCYLTIMAVALTSGMERGKPIPLLRTNEAVFVLSLGIAFVIMLTRKNRYPINFDRLGVALFVLVLGTSIIPGTYHMVRGTTLTFQDAIILLAPYQYAFLFLMFAYLPSNNRERLGIIKFMLVCSAVVAVVGVLQAAKIGFVTDLLHNWYGSSHEKLAASYGRITSLLGSWNTLGIFMMFNLIILWAFGISRPSDLGWPTILAVGGVCIACLILSGSFAGVIGLILGIMLISMFLGVYLNRRNIILFLVMIIAISVTFVLFQQTILIRWNQQFGYGGSAPSTLVARFRLWQDIYLPAIQKNLFWGINPTIPDYYAWRYTESQYLELLFSFGLVGFISYLSWNAITLNSLLRRFYQHGDFLRTVSAIAITIIIILFVAGFSNAVFTYSGTIEYMWIILALITAQEGLKQKPPV
jgi:hypothetical protein